MRGTSASGSPARSGWLGFLGLLGLLGYLRAAHFGMSPSGGRAGSWLRPWASGVRPAADGLLNESRQPGPDHGASVRVLVVDDNPVNLMVVSALMAPKGLVPLLAADGAEAVALACEMHFDLILMDLQMPVLDGWEATAAIRRFESRSSRPAVPIVAYSCTLPGPGVLGIHGMNGSLDKPCDDQDLEDCLLQWCPGYRPASTLSGAPDAGSRWQTASRGSARSSAALR